MINVHGIERIRKRDTIFSSYLSNCPPGVDHTGIACDCTQRAFDEVRTRLSIPLDGRILSISSVGPISEPTTNHSRGFKIRGTNLADIFDLEGCDNAVWHWTRHDIFSVLVKGDYIVHEVHRLILKQSDVWKLEFYARTHKTPVPDLLFVELSSSLLPFVGPRVSSRYGYDMH